MWHNGEICNMQAGCISGNSFLSQLRILISSHIPSSIQWGFFLGRAFLGLHRRKAGGLWLVLVREQPWEKWGEEAETARYVSWLLPKDLCLC